MLLEVVRIVFIEYLWYVVFVVGMNNLCLRGGFVVEFEVSGNLFIIIVLVGYLIVFFFIQDYMLNWVDLFDLSMYVFDKWFNFIELDDYILEDVDVWKCWNLFVLQFLNEEYMNWIILFYWEICLVLEFFCWRI